MKPKVSFVIPAYNAQKYLAQTLLSCRMQSEKNIQIVVVDDGSTDGTSELVEWHRKQDSRILFQQLSHNVGRSAARNIGNSLAEAPIILVLDADDLATRSRVKDTLITFSLKNPDVVYGPFQLMDELANPNQRVNAAPFNKELALKKKLNYICHSTMAYRKGVTMNVQYDEGEFSKLGLDDWKFQWDCFLKGYKFGVAKNVLCHYRVCQVNTESTRDGRRVEELKDEYISRISNVLAGSR